MCAWFQGYKDYKPFFPSVKPSDPAAKTHKIEKKKS